MDIETYNENNQTAEENKIPYTVSTIESLSTGLLEHYEPHLIKTKRILEELINKQSVLNEQIHNENLLLNWSLSSADLISSMNMVKEYHRKLVNIKKNMRLLHERSFKLKKRALNLQQYKEKEILARSQQIQHEENLIRKPSSSKNYNNDS